MESSKSNDHQLQPIIENKTTTPKEVEEGTSCVGPHKQGGWTTFPFIIGTLSSLSIAGGGYASNSIVFLISVMNVKSIKATQISNLGLGFFSLIAVVGAILSDSFFGPFSVIAFFTCLSLLGGIMLTLIVTVHSLRPPPCTNIVKSLICQPPSKLQYAFLYATLTLTTLGIGGTRFTTAAMGADQFEKPGDRESFFNWFFLSLYVCNAISFTAIIYIQGNVSWRLGFGICVVANAVGLVVFLLGKRFYQHVKPKGSPFTSMARVVVASIRKRKLMKADFDSESYYHGSTTGSAKMHIAPTKSFRFLNCAALKTDDDDARSSSSSDCSNSRSWRLCTVEEVEDLKTLIKIVPLWSTGIFLSTPIGMFNSLVVLQALSMDRHLGSHFKIPAATFLVFNLLATAISIALIDRLLIPTWQYLIGRPLTFIQRIGIGHVINVVGLVGSALMEMRRLDVFHTHNLAVADNVVPMSALWLILPLVIFGLGEGFHFPGQIALFYQEFPVFLKSMSTAMISLLFGIGFYLSTAITDLIQRTTRWLPDDINEGRVDNVFWMLAVIGVVNFGYYIVCAKLFKCQHNVDHESYGPSEPAI